MKLYHSLRKTSTAARMNGIGNEEGKGKSTSNNIVRENGGYKLESDTQRLTHYGHDAWNVLGLESYRGNFVQSVQSRRLQTVQFFEYPPKQTNDSLALVTRTDSLWRGHFLFKTSHLRRNCVWNRSRRSSSALYLRLRQNGIARKAIDSKTGETSSSVLPTFRYNIHNRGNKWILRFHRGNKNSFSTVETKSKQVP